MARGEHQPDADSVPKPSVAEESGPSLDPGTVRAGGSSAPEADLTRPIESGSVRLATVYPTDEFVPDPENPDVVITRAGTDVRKGDVQSILTAAESVGEQIVQIEVSR